VNESSQASEQSPQGGDWMAFASLGITVAVVIGGFLALGLWLDSVLGCSPALLLVGIVLGMVVAALVVVSNVKRRM
jgi:F0F1-type ATP synthase assembly protein I